MPLVIQNISNYSDKTDDYKYHGPMMILTMGIGGFVCLWSIWPALVIWLFAIWIMVKSGRLDEVYRAERYSNFETHLKQLPTDLLSSAAISPELNRETRSEIIKYLNKNRQGWSMMCQSPRHPH